jgi:hypothetical protein
MERNLAYLLPENMHRIFDETDLDKRKAAIADLWDEDGIFIDPEGVHHGPERLSAAVTALQHRFPGSVFRVTSPIQEYFGVGRVSWEYGPPGGAVSDRVYAASDAAAVVAFRRPGELLVLIGNVGPATTIVPLNLQDVLDPEARYAVRIYNSERGSWERGRRETEQSASSLAVTIEANGFRAVDLRESRRKGDTATPAHDYPIGKPS